MKNLLIVFAFISFATFGQISKGIQASKMPMQGINIYTPGSALVGDLKMVQTPYITTMPAIWYWRDDQHDRIGFGSPAPAQRLHVYTPLPSTYELDIAGNAKIDNELVVLGRASVNQLNIDLNDGPLHVAENMVFSGPVYKSEVAEIEAGRILYGNDNDRGKTNPVFYYDDATETLHVPNIIVTGIEPYGVPKVKETDDDLFVFNEYDYVLVDASKKDVRIFMNRGQWNAKTLVVKRIKGKHRVYIETKDESIRLKGDEPMKVLFDGLKWHKIL